MSVAIRAITRVQDADDAPTLGAGQDGYALTWNNATGAFVATALVTDHGALTGLTPDDDHTQYALLAGRAGGQTLYGGTAENEDITIHGTSNATRTTSYVLLQPTAGNVGIGTSAPAVTLHVEGNVSGTSGMPIVKVKNVSTGTGYAIVQVAANKYAQFVFQSDLDVFQGQFTYDVANTRMAFHNGRSGVGAVITFSAGTNDYVASERMRITGEGLVGIGTTAPATQLHVTSTTATTDALRNVLTLGANVTSTGVGAAGLGAAVLFTAETTTTADTTMARVQALWYEATHATFKADLVGTAYDAGGEREGWRVRGAGSAAAIGFLGATPQARIAHVADPSGGATVDAEARSAINSILSTLELFGFHAAS